MAGNPSESLAALEVLMNEFFAPETTNERKREIELMLNNFSKQSDSWKHCLYFMSHSANHYVCMYSLSTIETLITKRWVGLGWEDRAQLRATLYQLAVEQHQTAPAFLRNKLVKLVVDIARLDWPHFYPDFFTNVLLLIRGPETTSLGLIFLRTASEELACPWEDLSISRKEELRRLLLGHMPQVFSLLSGLLENIAQKQTHGATATPPPSPTHGQPTASSPVHTGTLLSSMLNVSRGDTNDAILCRYTLQALTHLFSWVPLSPYVTPNLLAAIFHLAGSSQTAGGECLGTLALGAVNELLYRNCIPAACEDLLLSVVQQATVLLQADHQDLGCREKLTELLQLLVSQHWRRLEACDKFAPLEFLALLFKYTFQHGALKHLHACLEVWNTFLDLQQPARTRYLEVLVSLVGQVLRRMQFKYNQCQLEDLDVNTLDDDEQTEWQHFLRPCIETVAKVSELAPEDTWNLVHEPWREACGVYLALERAVTEGRMGVVSAEESLRLHCLLRDLASLTQTVGRLCPHFVDGALEPRFAQAQALATRLAGIATYAARAGLHRAPHSAHVLPSDLIHVHSQTLAALQAWCYWTARLSESALKSALVAEMAAGAVPVLTRPAEPATLALPAAHLLATLSATVRPHRLWEMPVMAELYRSAPTLQHLQPETWRLVQRALCNSLLLPSGAGGSGDHQWERRQQLLVALVDTLTAEFRRSGNPVAPTLNLLSDLVNNVLSEGSHTKKMLHAAIQPSILRALTLFPQYVHAPDVCEAILDFFLAAFNSLQQQLGVDFTEEVLQTFLNVFTREQLSSSLQQEGGAGARVVDKLLQLLTLVVSQPGAAFKRFIPSSLALCLDHVYPLVAETSSPDVKPALFSLFHAVLLHRWQWFYRGSAPVQHRETLVAILRAYGQSLLQPDINLFGQNLRSLETLNNKWRLYHKCVFREELLGRFLTVLLHALVHKSQPLLGDDIAVAVFNMAAVNLDAFHIHFLPDFLANTQGLDDSQRANLGDNFKRDSDLPSFTHNVQRLVNDLRCYRLCNSSIEP